MKPFSEACEQNKLPILAVLQRYLTTPSSLLEVGSGTGQHAVFFAQQFPILQWHASDIAAHLPGIKLWLKESHAKNLHGPHELDVNQRQWPLNEVDYIYSANTTHIMHWPDVIALFNGVGRVLKPNGYFFLYGPFAYNGKHTSQSNADFDRFLKQRDPDSGIRDLADLQQLANDNALELVEDVAMPVNNRTLVWHKIE